MEDLFDSWDDVPELSPEPDDDDELNLWDDSDDSPSDSDETNRTSDSYQDAPFEWKTNDSSLEEDVENLQKRAKGIERSEHSHQISFGSKWCPTRHGCQGATDCDYCMGSAR